MGEIKEKKKSPHFLFVTSASPWDKKCTKKKRKKKNLYMNVPCMTQRILGVWQRKKKKTSLMTKLRAIPSPLNSAAGTRLIPPQDFPIHRLAAFDTTSELPSFLLLRTVTICGCLPSPPPTYHYHCAIV